MSRERTSRHSSFYNDDAMGWKDSASISGSLHCRSSSRSSWEGPCVPAVPCGCRTGSARRTAAHGEPRGFVGTVLRLRLVVPSLGTCFRLAASDSADRNRVSAAACRLGSFRTSHRLRPVRGAFRHRFRICAEPLDPVAVVLSRRQWNRDAASRLSDGVARGVLWRGIIGGANRCPRRGFPDQPPGKAARRDLRLPRGGFGQQGLLYWEHGC